MIAIYRAGLTCILIILSLLSIYPATCLSEGFQQVDQSRRADLPPILKSYTNEEALLLGERMYRKGILPDGKLMQAFVEGDIPVDGNIFTCELCHRRSGLGTSEGYVIALPINSQNLLRPRVLWDPRRRHSGAGVTMPHNRQIPDQFSGKALRPAYTDTTLAHALRAGIDPTGRELDHIMPRYALNDTEMALLVYYLKNLTKAYSPGVTNTTIHFATIVSDKVSKEKREAMLDVLKAYIKNKNSQTRNQIKRAKGGAFNRRELDSAYRLLELSVWELSGPESGWEKQLEDYYKKSPVFAIIGGITGSDWTPVHTFSETHNIPTFLPVTDRPVVSDDVWNTVYFSKGLYQEGDTTARYIKRYMKDVNANNILQVYRKGTAGENAAKGFAITWKGTGGSEAETYELQDDAEKNRRFLAEAIEKREKKVVVFWGDSKAIVDAGAFSVSAQPGQKLFVSSTLLNDDYTKIPDNTRENVFLSYPYSLPDEKNSNIRALKIWLKVRGISDDNLKIKAKMYFLGWRLSAILTGMKSEFYRDYFLETVEMLRDQTSTIPIYPRLSIGPGQRYLSKGCYIVQLSKGNKPSLIRKSDWIVH